MRGLLLLLCLCAASPAAAEDVCRHLTRTTSPVVDLALPEEAPALDHSQTLQQMAALRTSYDAAALEKSDHAAGLYAAGFNISWSIDYRSVQHPQTREACVDLSRLAVTVTLVDPKIFIAREVNYGSCLYRAVLEHEQRHARVDRQILETARYSMRDTLRRRVMALERVPAGSVTLAGELLKSQVADFMQPLMNALSLERVRLQADIDTKEEYQRVSKLCEDDVRALAETSGLR